MKSGKLRWSVAVFCVLCLATAAVAGEGAAAGARADGAESPEALVAALAKVEKPWQAMPYMVPDERAQMSMAMLVGAQMMVAMSQFGIGMAEGMGEGVEEAMSAEDRREMDAQLAAAREQSAAMEARMQEILARHELTEAFAGDGPADEAALEALLVRVDHVALLRDLFALMEELGASEGTPDESMKKVGELRDLEVTGDTATGMVGDEEMRFRRIDGRWYMSMEGQGGPPFI
jgi:hypothetical protein